MSATKDSYLLNSKVASFKSGRNAAGIPMSFFSTLQRKTISFLQELENVKISKSIII